jgi:hypothetical protein
MLSRSFVTTAWHVLRLQMEMRQDMEDRYYVSN